MTSRIHYATLWSAAAVSAALLTAPAQASGWLPSVLSRLTGEPGTQPPVAAAPAGVPILPPPTTPRRGLPPTAATATAASPGRPTTPITDRCRCR